MALARFTRKAGQHDYDEEDRQWAVNPAFVVEVSPIKGDAQCARLTVNWGMGCDKVDVRDSFDRAVEKLRHAERQIVEVAQ